MPTEREKQILDLIRQDPLITQKELAQKLGITRPGVASHISRLIKEGLISGKGYVLPRAESVTVIGAVNMDIYGTLDQNRVQSTISNPGKITTQLGGMGRNIAANLAALGVATNLITVFGNDPSGEQFKADALRRGINISYARQLVEDHTSIYLYVNRQDGRRVVGVDDMTINRYLTPDYLQANLATINASKLVIFDTNLPKETIHWLYDNVQAPMLAKAVSVNKAPNLVQENRHLTGLVINGIEGTVLTGQAITGMADAVKCARQLYQQFTATIYLYVDGLGIVIDDGQRVIKSQYAKVPAPNLNGVGTAIVGAIGYGELHQLANREKLTLAKRAAKITGQTPHNVSSRIKDILK
ncbi:PfkB family carbohydrate kinase [Limosilactobacillus sp.]|jgi:pseudouridine kinase|uniref:PfkB family carbohydrate kinase n=1 Tax=Limosilactobacillus sp. TaxID=2773925 RepID=UPI0025BFD1DA|nr:PfkB family carbohydrate kinase [Limosilactobacillus sp.]MCH3921688.1 PfkB family carbohydrate kinase [Limosilactobacillus sp.]MCH3928459.1 PfkB family carbohydrate kinase [Limosilactobacillus sp.]